MSLDPMFSATNSGGTGSRLTRIVVVLAGVASLSASLVSFVAIWLQTKNYRKPLLQRFVVRILVMVPIYSAASWASIMSVKAAFWIDPVRDIYEAFTIYTFFQLLVAFLGGERSLIIMMHGRPPVQHLWPLNYCFPKVDISDPHTFLAVKRGVLQYTWLKPVLALATITMKATGTYQEGYIGLRSGYFWTGLFYNVSVCLSLYSLGMFWACMSQDLKPFRPMPKFLCVKLIIFASWWQGFFLSILVWLGAIPDDVEGFTPDNLAAALQDALICFEMPIFAIAHWYAFSWHDYADITISAARLPVKYAFRDAFGIRDLIEDTKETFRGGHYQYRYFDAGDNVLTHEESASRIARMREGMRFERGGKGKYWIPQPGQASVRTPLLAKAGPDFAHNIRAQQKGRGGRFTGDWSKDVDPVEIDPAEEQLYANARALEFGDWNYPVITAHQASREHWLRATPTLVTPSTNRHVLQPTKDNRIRRKSDIQKTLDKGKHPRRTSHHRDSSSLSRSQANAPLISGRIREHSTSSSSRSDDSQLVDLVIEDTHVKDIERVRARKEGGAGWNEIEPRKFVRAYPDDDQGQEVHKEFEPHVEPPLSQEEMGDPSYIKGDVEGERISVGFSGDADDARQWGQSDTIQGEGGRPTYGSFNEENVWK